MKCTSVGAIKGKANNLHHLYPTEGTKIRRVYDLFCANKGKVIDYRKDHSAVINQLRDVYGLDIICLQPRKWCLVGEWFGNHYVDYLAEKVNK